MVEKNIELSMDVINGYNCKSLSVHRVRTCAGYELNVCQ